MRKLLKQDYLDLVETVRRWQNTDNFQPINWGHYGGKEQYIYSGEVVPKQRPRKGKNGHMFTPTETRNFEATVKSWGVESKMSLFTCPIRVDLVIYDSSDNDETRLHSIGGLTFYMRKDLDNMQKSIFDALNGVMYRDDKQIVDESCRRRYAVGAGFRLTVERAGLSKTEYSTFLKYLRAAEKNA